jgi:hypothetical protein
MAGEKLSFTEPVRDDIRFTVAGGAGSCPVLYSWSEPYGRWERHGKIIHAALTQANRQSETVRFNGWVSRFLIAEEELEITHLHEVRAVIRLQDGTIRDLVPERTGRRASSDGRPITLLSGDEAEFRLTLPDGLAAEMVAETRLVINGYYERYSALLASKVGRQLQPRGASARVR